MAADDALIQIQAVRESCGRLYSNKCFM